jgi:23S rRNA pseudouridine1911/1915/1917 synthase
LRSELTYAIIAKAENQWLLEVSPITGRPHQIRVQLASMGCSIKGDVKYGAEQPNADASICLHAKKLEFIHPVKKEKVLIEAAPPANGLWNIFLKLRS